MLTGLPIKQANPARTPIGENQDSVDDGDGTVERPNVKMFYSLIGNLLRLSRFTRPDISLAVHRESLRTHAPQGCDWRWAKRIIRYFKGTVGLKSQLKCTTVMGETPTIMLESYSDAVRSR